MGKKWRIRVSIPVPPACKAGALPLELIPQSYFFYDQWFNIILKGQFY